MVSPYLMQRVMNSVINKMLEHVKIKIMIYLDDILLMGQPNELEKAKVILFASSFLFNLSKCDLNPTKCLTYLGVKVDLTQKTLALTKNFVIKITKEFIKIRKYNLILRYKQRIAGLLNFAIPIIRLPIQMIHLAYYHHRKLYKFINFIHFYPMSYQTFVNDMPIYTDATPNQIGLISPYDNKISVLTSKQPILENEYLGILISHIIRPTAIIATDNKPAMYLFRKGRFPPKWRQNYKLTKLIIEIFRKPIVIYVNTKLNPADIVSRANIINV